MEIPNVQVMIRKDKLASEITDVAWSSFSGVLKDKAPRGGSAVIQEAHDLFGKWSILIDYDRIDIQTTRKPKIAKHVS
jgi:hypothetical protein